MFTMKKFLLLIDHLPAQSPVSKNEETDNGYKMSKLGPGKFLFSLRITQHPQHCTAQVQYTATVIDSGKILLLLSFIFSWDLVMGGIYGIVDSLYFYTVRNSGTDYFIIRILLVSVLLITRLTSDYSGDTHHHSTNSYEPIRFLQTSQNRLINIHRKSLKHISQSALFGFSKNIGHDQIWYENSVVFKAVQWLFMIKERSCKLCYIVDSLVKT